MILHIIPAEKFTRDYIIRIRKLFSPKSHLFMIYGESKKEYNLESIRSYENIFMIKTLSSNKELFKSLISKSEKVICHSLFLKLIDLQLLRNSVRNSKQQLYWAIWGKDLYEDYEKARNTKGLMKVKFLYKEKMRRDLIERMNAFITTGDYDALVERYKIRDDSSVIGAQYTYNLIDEVETVKNPKAHVLVGHSATKTCRHIETLKTLSIYASSIEVFCPLSYPDDKEYVSEVTEFGEKLFGGNFHAITSFMNYEEYINFLNTIDIGVFNNSRQQGMGNITNLLYLGKKVYLSKDNTINKSYRRGDYHIFDYDDIMKQSFLTPLSKDEAFDNKRKIRYKFSDENFKMEWEKVFKN